MKIGFIGAGNIGRTHIEAFAALRDAGEDVDLFAVADSNRAAATACAEEFGIAEPQLDAMGLIRDRRVDALVLAVPNAWHAPLAMAALRAGKHLLLEKPMGANLADAQSIFQAQQETARVVMLCHQMRWTWWAQAMRRRVEGGELGEVYHARTGWLRRQGIPGWGTWFTRKESSGGGPLIDLGVHMLDLTLHLLGNPVPVSVTGVTAAKFGPRRRGIGKWGTPDWEGEFDVEDFASALVRLGDGRVLNLDVSWAAHVDRPGEYIELLGADAGLSYHSGGLKFLTEREGELFDETIEEPATHERLEMTREFLECARSGSQPACGAFSGLVNNAVLDAIYRSSAGAAEVAIELPGAGPI